MNLSDLHAPDSGISDPRLNITATVSCPVSPQQCRTAGLSFFVYYIHAAAFAANELPSLRTRLQNGIPVCLPSVDPAVTVARDDGSFAFCRLSYNPCLHRFAALAEPLLEEARQSRGLEPTERSPAVIHFSVAPWLPFSAIAHAGSLDPAPSIPIIAIGARTGNGASAVLPASLQAHSALVSWENAAAWFHLFGKRLKEAPQPAIQ